MLVDGGSKIRIPGYLDDSFLDRVRASYRLALRTTGAGVGRTWRTINMRQASVHAALMANTNAELRKIYADPISSDLFYGVDNLSKSVLANPDDPGAIAALGASARSDLFRLCQALNLDRGLYPDSFEPEEVLRRADQPLNQSIAFPNVFRGELGLQTTRGIASYRAIQALYQAARLVSLVDRSDEKSVVEIGPGMGRTAYYAYRGGLTDFTTIDLPMGIVAQACFLGATLGPEKIWMAGDEERLATGRIRLLAAGSKPSRKFGIVLNCDSMTEMPRSAALNYVDWITDNSRLFLSINHEINPFTVADVTTMSLERISRCSYPLRANYWEEIFIPNRSPRSLALRLRQQISIFSHAAWFVANRAPAYLRRRILPCSRRPR
jgi:hypothetical protein